MVLDRLMGKRRGVVIVLLDEAPTALCVQYGYTVSPLRGGSAGYAIGLSMNAITVSAPGSLMLLVSMRFSMDFEVVCAIDRRIEIKLTPPSRSGFRDSIGHGVILCTVA